MVEPAPTPQGSIDSRYRRLLELGRGGTARVYLAKSRVGLRRLVVLKTLEPGLAADAEMRELFRREAEVCARLNHPNIVQVHEVIEEGSGPVIVMEYLDGIALSQAILRSEGRFSKRLYLHALTQLLAGLHYFHELRDYDRTKQLNAVHRDVSPQNVILLHEGAVKVLDFGIAKLDTEAQTTRTGVVKGKLHYMPAEQLLSDCALDRRADLFSAGVMLWEALAGRRMWHGHTENTVMRLLVSGKLPSLRDFAPEYPDYFYEVVSRATAFDPNGRHQTALEMQIDVERILGDLGGQVHPRELSSFMQTEFGEYRQQREAAIETAVKQSLLPAPMLSVPDAESTRNHRHPPLFEMSRSDVVTAQEKRGRRNVILSVTLLLAATALGVVTLTKRHSHASAVAAASVKPPAPAASILHLEVTSNPPNAEAWLDGKLLGRTPWKGTLSSRKEPATLELKADNHEPETRTVALTEDLSLEILLRPSPGLPSEGVANTDQKKTTKRSKSVVSPPKVTPATHTGNSPECSPPYTLSPDGIKTYKAECFGDAKQP